MLVLALMFFRVCWDFHVHQVSFCDCWWSEERQGIPGQSKRTDDEAGNEKFVEKIKEMDRNEVKKGNESEDKARGQMMKKEMEYS